MDADAGLSDHRLDQKFTGPGRPTPTMLLRVRANDLIEQAQKVVIEFVLSVVFAAIPQTALAVRAKVACDAVDRGVVNGQGFCGFARGPSVPQVEDDEVAGADSRLRALAKPLFDLLLVGVTRFGNEHENSLWESSGPGILLGNSHHFIAKAEKRPVFSMQLIHAQ